MMRWGDVEIQVDTDDALIVDGVKLPIDIIPELLYCLAHPDPRRWYRFERVGNSAVVHVKISEEKPNGSVISIISSNEDSRGKGKETPRA